MQRKGPADIRANSLAKVPPTRSKNSGAYERLERNSSITPTSQITCDNSNNNNNSNSTTNNSNNNNNNNNNSNNNSNNNNNYKITTTTATTK
ncbi:hypothetical protein PoB_005784600 [Plakobranchus ocellatus]|uniref:Uncharacterized protein n=1 Tax=Plakobranchus ocellatus TaxID=259542 RepID=A0AAV4CEZ1_9GAST|nr:hypothetical protein PoB_005784600 [Plakobranchus ocellatus]